MFDICELCGRWRSSGGAQHCLLASGGAHLPSALRSCEITCSSGCVLTTWSAWSPCGYSHDSTRTRRRELVGSLSANEDCGTTFKLIEEEKCPAIPEQLVFRRRGQNLTGYPASWKTAMRPLCSTDRW
ncbi:thrombospondin type-1 domain-containing protein 7A [Caerostris extrusa]|uniref:Thrombospondin type-1 domain-containing protein 7A n=1 Tax=Caerostris extrusa TaxID=172846 RepID=A0AAV4YER2_CAEEX|nr:thrombospondin type-1 domain-containing protein 7A [Caerostris extrusa]